MLPTTLVETRPDAKYLPNMADGDEATVGTLSAASGSSASVRASGFGNTVDPDLWDDVWLRIPIGWAGAQGDAPEKVRCYVRPTSSDPWVLATERGYSGGSDYTFSIPMDVILSGLNSGGVEVELIYDHANSSPPSPSV